MRQVIVTDVRYRTAMAVIRPLAKAGYEVCGVQTKQESPAPPPAFFCKYLARRELLEALMDKPLEEMQELYNHRDIEK